MLDGGVEGYWQGALAAQGWDSVRETAAQDWGTFAELREGGTLPALLLTGANIVNP